METIYYEIMFDNDKNNKGQWKNYHINVYFNSLDEAKQYIIQMVRPYCNWRLAIVERATKIVEEFPGIQE